MPPTTSFDFGDVVLVPFPFTDLQTTKKRPAVIVSSAAYHHHQPDVIFMAITSRTRLATTFGDQVLHDWQQAGLVKTSVLKPLLATIDSTLVINQIGRLSATDLTGLKHVLDNILGP